MHAVANPIYPAPIAKNYHKVCPIVLFNVSPPLIFAVLFLIIECHEQSTFRWKKTAS